MSIWAHLALLFLLSPLVPAVHDISSQLCRDLAMEMFLVQSPLLEGLQGRFGHPHGRAALSVSVDMSAAGKTISLHWRQAAALGSVLVTTETEDT